MNQGNKENPDQNNSSKWIIVILLFILIPPVGVFYVWKKREYFSRKLHLLLWFFGGWSIIYPLYFLIVAQPRMHNVVQRMGIEPPVLPGILLSFAILFSISSILFGFLVNKKIASLHFLPKNYLITAYILLLLVSFNIIIIGLSVKPYLFILYRGLGI